MKDEKVFNETFEKVFNTFDQNKDKTIGDSEYAEFFQLMIGSRKVNLQGMIKGFFSADKDKDGRIDKEEFKKELKNKLKEFVESHS